MLEGLVAWVLNNYLGKYVENLNTDQLSIALLTENLDCFLGEVELENLPLRKDALRHLGLPIIIKSGSIGKIKLQIPVRQIRSAPWVINIEQMYVVASPLAVHEWDPLVEETAAQELKLSALDAIEARWRFEIEAKDSSTYYASTYSSWLSFGTGLITDIIENLQLRIKDVHLRYEDNFSIPKEVITFGLTMDYLSVQSCDSSWVPGFLHWSTSTESYKILEMHKLAIYCLTVDSSQVFSKLSPTEIMDAMSLNQHSGFVNHYILPPVSAEAHLKKNRSERPLRSSDTPRFVCNLTLQEVPITLVDVQYNHIIKCLRGVQDVTELRSYRQFRPLSSVKSDAKAWWLYAINCQYPDRPPSICKPRPTWETCLDRARENVQYVKLYTKVLMTPAITLTPENKKLKDDIEWNRDYEQLKVLREIAMRAVPKPNSTSNGSSTGRSILFGWFPQWMGWYSNSNPDPGISNNNDTTDTAQLEDEILEALKDTADNNTLLKRDAIFGEFNFSLKGGSLRLCSTSDSNIVTMLELQYKDLSLHILSRPRTSSYLVELSLGGLSILDKLTPNSLFPILVGPPGNDRMMQLSKVRGPISKPSSHKNLEDSLDVLFYLAYEQKPENSLSDYRLNVRSKSLDVVYQPAAVKWLTEFLCFPHQQNITQMRIEAVKLRTKKEFMKNWEQILDGHPAGRKNWELHLDVSAPQIIVVENFTDPNSAMAVIDFGRLQLQNSPNKTQPVNEPLLLNKTSEEDDKFMTPCSTPPGSEASISDSLSLNLPQNAVDTLNEESIHRKLYDCYCLEFTDLQVLIGRVKDNWRYAHNRGTSTLHVLDRFNISLQIEHRVVHTCDPLYPSLTVCANLPKLVAHLNEQKISAARGLIEVIKLTSLPSPFNTPSDGSIRTPVFLPEDEDSVSFDTSLEMSRLLIFQFTVDQLALEVQSRGRSIAELQVSGVKTAFSKRHGDDSITLSVHSLLLVDALQTFGPDFELLVASHKHVGMDSMSGSLRDSEPTSPTSPASPDPSTAPVGTTSPVALSQALNTLATSPTSRLQWQQRTPIVLDAEALITIEIILVKSLEPMHIANIQFNNLDIIANQETLVELMGFVQRVFPELKSQKPLAFVPSPVTEVYNDSSGHEPEMPLPKICRTELTFDFHRLNVLLLRGVLKDGALHGRKIATATMSEAKIRATVENSVVVEGSLGGLQVLDLTPEGHLHQRIISVGRDPLLETPHPLYIMSKNLQDERRAFSFKIDRKLHSENVENESALVVIRMASVWYTHSPQFLLELQSCVTEFKQYLANLARSIRSAATDMALGLVHARAEALAQSLYMNSRFSASLYGSAMSLSDIMTPRKRSRYSSNSYGDCIDGHSGYSSLRDTVPQTPYSPVDESNFLIDMKLDIILDSPVVVLPRTHNSPQVFVAHLGKTSVTNCSNKQKSESWDNVESKIEHYDVEIRDMNLYSLDTTSRRVPGPLMNRSEVLYNCDTLAKPILHNTIVQLTIEREIFCNPQSRHHSLSNLLDDDGDLRQMEDSDLFFTENIQISGSVVTALKVSLTHLQYEQLLDTFQWLMESPQEPNINGLKLNNKLISNLEDISEEDIGVTTLKMDPHVRAKLFPVVSAPKTKSNSKKFITFKVLFELPIFTIELRGDSPNGEQGFVDLSFQDFIFNYEKCHRYETNIQVSLRSVIMEDLLQPEGSRQRCMVVSSSGGEPPASSTCVSRSCPDMYMQLPPDSYSHGSLPDHLETSKVLGIMEKHSVFPSTPPPSPSIKDRPQKNLVLISSLLVDPNSPNFQSYYNSIQRSTSIDFNCLDLVISVESWVVVLDFFSAVSTEKANLVHEASAASRTEPETTKEKPRVENVETNISVRSLTMTLVTSDHDIAKANVSHVDVSIKSNNIKKEVEGRLGSMSLLDLTLQGQLYKERFLTSGKQALRFNYVKYYNNEIPTYDAQLKLEMSSVFYVHTKRFIVELQAFFQHFTQLQSVMQGIRAAASSQKIIQNKNRLSIILQAGAPVIVLPVSSRSSDLLIADLGRLSLTNTFKYSGDLGTISFVNPSAEDKKCLLDVMLVDLQNVDLYSGVRMSDHNIIRNETNSRLESLHFGMYKVTKSGPSLLTEKCHLKVQIERNLDNDLYHSVPDMSVHGKLSTLDVALDLNQYRLIKNLLTHNLGENTEHILPSVTPITPLISNANIREMWTLTSLKFDLSNVILRLQIQHGISPLARINFIKSRLTVESFSNLSQDVDLVSQEILVMDTRFQDVPTNQCPNIYTNILQPINLKFHDDLVQAEIHSRKRQDRTKFTILLNNMRLMAVFDWWDTAMKYILENPNDEEKSLPEKTVVTDRMDDTSIPFELKLNITDCEIVVVEDTSQWDTNAVIFKSTTVLSYKPYVIEKPLSCNLNNCEMYSCILGTEEETALSIIDPVTLNLEINKNQTLEVQLQTLMVRLSYHDMRMFLQILNSLPKQMLKSKTETTLQSSSLKSQITKLSSLGFVTEDCVKALMVCPKLDDAALWLTQNAIPMHNFPSPVHHQSNATLSVSAVEIKADCIYLCVIDDCGDADVPLLEFSLAQLNMRQHIGQLEISDEILAPVEGALECKLSADYYNRVFSGWEPLIEPWKCEVVWDHVFTTSLTKNRSQLNIESQEVLNVNITSSLMDLYKQVRDSWMQDYYNSDNGKETLTPHGYRRRSPFVPFALKNELDLPLYFTTLISDMELYFHIDECMEVTDKWVLVAPGQTVPFSFRIHDKRRHGDSHRLRMHQLGIKVDGWKPLTPVTVDKVGTYFRQTTSELQYRNQEITSARIVFDVTLEGSARKLVTVRSGLLIRNKLKENLQIRLENPMMYEQINSHWKSEKFLILPHNEALAVPLTHVHSHLTVRPVDKNLSYTYCSPNIYWADVQRSGESIYTLRACQKLRDPTNYRFCAEIRKENFLTERAVNAIGYSGQPVHTITFLPMLLLVNLLPIDLNYNVFGGNGRISPGSREHITHVDAERVIELKLCLENFPVSNILTIPIGCVSGFTCRIRFEDNFGRKLYLQALVVPYSEARIRVTISASYWIINKTGLPLVFRQKGVSSETAGQFEEHEIARMVAPLLFSFSDPDASPSVVVRVGNAVLPQGTAQWCQDFDLQRGIKVRKLRVSLKDGQSDVVYLVGIEVRTGRGRYRSTNIVTISPRFQLHNRSSYNLLFAQSCFATTVSDPFAEKTYLKVIPECYIPYHWRRLDKDQLLCVLICDIPNCSWSGGFKIDKTDSMHLNVRDVHYRTYFLRLEIVLQSATYFVIFTDADKMPPPIRVDNFSEVPVTFAQFCCKDVMRSIARAHTSVPYAWDQPTGSSTLNVVAPGGISNTYDMNNLGVASGLTYENFIYIAFTGTFKNGEDNRDPLDVESQQLVLDVIHNTQIVLARKQPGQRSQLWRMTTTGQLQHEGSSPPSHPQQPRTENILVLDIEGPAPQPTSYSKLMLRRLDPRRRSTQTWRFTEDGRLCCAHYNMCVQAQDGFFGLRLGNAAVLGLPQPVCHRVTNTGLPLEQAVCRQRLRPGSGFLSAEIRTDGPTRVLIIRDMKEQQRLYATSDENDWSSISLKQRPNLSDVSQDVVKETKELQFTLRLFTLGVSIISGRPYEELLYARFTSIVSEVVLTSSARTFCVSVKDVQFDNQLFDVPVSVVLYVTPPGSRSVDMAQHKLPALEFTAEIQPTSNEDSVVFKHLMVRLKKLTINLEEKLLLKLCAFLKAGANEEELWSSAEESDCETQRLLMEVSAAHAKRYYFGIIQLILDQIRLSMTTANKLPSQLQVIKRKLGFTFIKFEDAAVELEPFIRKHIFETNQILSYSIVKHFKDELLWQAGIILGSTDFLGNPIGFVNDVSEGVSSLIYEHSLEALVKNVTHGISNSAAKVTESLSDGLGRVAMDEEHEEIRQRIRQVESGKTGDHIVAGFKGLGFGILGGATGIFKQVYEGAANDGIQGVFSGFGKGIVGAVTKPVVGVLDLASETARAVRDSSRSSNRIVPERMRPPRCVVGAGGLLPCYSAKQSQGQQYLYVVNKRNYSEQLVAYELLRSGSEDLRIIVSNEYVRIVTGTKSNSLTTFLEVHISDVIQCQPVTLAEGSEIRHYVDITMRVAGTNAALVYTDPIKRPRIRCESMELAHSVSQQLSYAKRLYNDRLHTLISDNVTQSED
ncbi:hypothetical protein RN001_011883 [Aquatica leii]|uniref:Vacuolar protein sorting-associated protein 13D n=1 Tax=Aquatica leii TaxID=1421715 RepID=A0AAN7S7K5_9COLE|nr:hypothetical protein RN001_011883 [Aquatica leii]